MLLTTFDGDSRVDPMHARKMCAALQRATSGSRPVLLRHENGVGHGSRSVSRSVDLAADMLAFLAAHTGLARLGREPRQTVPGNGPAIGTATGGKPTIRPAIGNGPATGTRIRSVIGSGPAIRSATGTGSPRDLPGRRATASRPPWRS